MSELLPIYSNIFGVIIMYKTLSWVKIGLSLISLFQVGKLLCVNVLAVGEILLAWTLRQRSVTFLLSSIFLVLSLNKAVCHELGKQRYVIWVPFPRRFQFSHVKGLLKEKIAKYSLSNYYLISLQMCIIWGCMFWWQFKNLISECMPWD